MSTKIENKEPMEVKAEITRTYYSKVAIVGPTGTGKSYLTKTADRNDTGYINIENKPLPYKADPFKFEGRPKTWEGFMKNLKDYAENPDINFIIIDSQTEAFQILNTEMQKSYSNWDIAKHYNRKVREYLVYLKSIEKDIIVFSHDEFIKIGEEGKKKRMFVHNKEHDGKIEEHFSCVLYTSTKLMNGKPTYFLRTFEEDTSTKTPEGLFPSSNGENLLEIPNDANYIFAAVKKYYSK